MNNRLAMGITLAAAAVAGSLIGSIGLSHADRPTPRPTPIAEFVANHTLAACNPALPNIYANWQADTYTDDGGHTYGWAATLTCNPSPPQVIHIKNMPGAMSLTDAHAWCLDQGGTHVQTRFGVNVNTCVGITDY